MSDGHTLAMRRTAKARAVAALRRSLPATIPEPAVGTDAWRVLQVIRHAQGVPNWAIARAAKLPKDRAKYACQYLKDRGLAYPHRTEYRTPDGAGERVQSCWFPNRPPHVAQDVAGTRCAVALGYGRVCGTRLEDRVNGFGRVVWACPACERRNRGVCRTCPRPTVRLSSDGPAPWYCPACLKARRKQRDAIRCATPEYRQQKAAWERHRVARCKAAGLPHRHDRKAA